MPCVDGLRDPNGATDKPGRTTLTGILYVTGDPASGLPAYDAVTTTSIVSVLLPLISAVSCKSPDTTISPMSVLPPGPVVSRVEGICLLPFDPKYTAGLAESREFGARVIAYSTRIPCDALSLSLVTVTGTGLGVLSPSIASKTLSTLPARRVSGRYVTGTMTPGVWSPLICPSRCTVPKRSPIKKLAVRCAAAVFTESVTKISDGSPGIGRLLTSKAITRTGMALPLLSRIVSPMITEGDGSRISEIDSGPFGADMSTQASAKMAPTTSSDVTNRDFTRVVQRDSLPAHGTLPPPDPEAT